MTICRAWRCDQCTEPGACNCWCHRAVGGEVVSQFDGPVLPDALWAAASGPDRVREAISRDRGHYAPSQPVTLCGAPDGTEPRADWTPPLPPLPLWRRVGNRLVAPIAKLMGF